MTQRKLVAVLACRNNGSRLYGKPLQRLDIATGWSILDQVIANLKGISCIQDIVLAVSDGCDNTAFIEYAKCNSLPYVTGDPDDVLHRLIQGLDKACGTDLFRVTSESPFLYWQAVESAWNQHLRSSNDATFLDEIIDGCGFELISGHALRTSWENGDTRHRSELCSLYLRENIDGFRIDKLCYPPELKRHDLRLTVDYPEDLILCRAVYSEFKKNMLKADYRLADILRFVDDNPTLRSIVAKYTDPGYSTMYL